MQNLMTLTLNPGHSTEKIKRESLTPALGANQTFERFPHTDDAT